MSTIEEKRVYDERRGATVLYVASDTGLVRASVSDDTVGEFSLVDRRSAHDVAARSGVVAVATGEDVLLAVAVPGDGGTGRDGRDSGGGVDAPSFVETGFGPAVAVDVHGEAVVAAGPDGRLARRQLDADTTPGADGATKANAWEPIEAPASTAVRAIDGDLVGTDAGVLRLQGDRLVEAGLDDVRDVSAAGRPLAATANGCYALGNGWMHVLDASGRSGDEPGFQAVAGVPSSDGPGLDRAHAAAGPAIYERTDDEWCRAFEADAPIAGIVHGATTYAVTRTGVVLADPLADTDDPAAGDDADPPDTPAEPNDPARRRQPWRPTHLGVADVGGLAIDRRDRV